MRTKLGTKRWALPAIAASVAVAAAITAVLQEPDRSTNGAVDLTHAVRGTVVDESGRLVVDATVRASGSIVTSDKNGEFVLPLTQPALASAASAGHLPRTQAVAPGERVRIELTSQSEQALSLRFGGNVMFAPPGSNATVAEHADLLSGVAPLLQDADLSVVNLESPLIDDPTFDLNAPRPERFHPTKKSVQASATESAEALRISGVDVVSLGNDHAYDALGPGLRSTTEALDAAGVRHFGAGPTADEAWKPAIVQRDKGTVAFLGCTTVDGANNPIPYVAAENRGGAAECTTKRLERAVAEARTQADTVVVMIHGGTGLEREQTPAVRSLLDTATRAGAGVAVAGHPHVIGGMRAAGSAVVVESTGNLLYDQEGLGTALSYLPRIDVRGGRPVHTSVDPLVLQDHRPRPVVGAFADSASRIAAGVVEGSVRMQGAGAVVSAQTPGTATVSLPAGSPRRLAPGWWLGEAGRVRVGMDLLWGAGSFEDMDTEPGRQEWELGRAARTVSSASCVGMGDRPAEGKGVELVRSPVSTRDVYAAPGHRVGVDEGQHVSVIVDLRSASPGSELELHWYNSATGESSGSVEVAIPEGKWSAGACRQVRLDAVVPPGAVAARPILRLAPPDDALSGPRLAVDNVRLIAWAGAGESGRRFDTVEATEATTVSVHTDRPGDGTDPIAGNDGGTE